MIFLALVNVDNGLLKNNKSFLSKNILLTLLKDNFNISIKQNDIFYNSYGKPYIKENIIFFNYSHSLNYIFYIISDKECGADIQYHKKLLHNPIELANRFFHKKDLEFITKSNDLIKKFFDIWSIKESYIKKTGIGFNKGMDYFTLNFITTDFGSIIDERLDSDKTYFKTFNILENYSISIASNYYDLNNLSINNYNYDTTLYNLL